MPETFTYTGTRLATEVKNQFGDVGSVQITDALILNWINNGQRQIAASNPFNEQVLDTNLIADQATYDLNTLLAGQRVMNYSSIVAADQVLEVIPWTEYLSSIRGRPQPDSSSRTPQYASEYGGRLTIWPTPAESVVGGLTVYYVAWPADLTALSQELTVPDRFYNALSEYVFAKALELDENFEAAQVVQAQHEKSVAMELQRDKMDPTDFYPSIVFEDRWS